MSKSAERLIILNDVCRGLLARVYNMTGARFKRPVKLDVESRFCKLLVKRFPDHPVELDRAAGAEQFKERAQEISSDLEDYYLTYMDVLDFSDAAWALLSDLSKSLVSLRFKSTPDLLAGFMNLFVGYAKLHLLMARTTDPKLMLSAYARAYHQTHGNSEANFGRVAAYIEQYSSDPLVRLRDQATELRLVVGDSLDGLVMHVLPWSGHESFTERKVFDVLEDAKSVSDPVRTDMHLELLNLDSFHTWILYGFLLCPGELQKPNAMALLGHCLKQHFVVPIYRDHMLHVHEKYASLFESFKENKFKLSKHKKVLKEAREDALSTVLTHRRTRTYLRIKLASWLALFTEFPQLLGPKMMMLMAALRLARGEILWYVTHLEVQPYKPKKYFKERTEFLDLHVTTLIYMLERVSRLVRSEQAVVQDFYLSMLRGSDSQKLRPRAEAFLAGPKVSQGVKDLVSGVVKAIANADLNDDFESTRLNWYRASASINSQQTGAHSKQADDLGDVMTEIIVHTRNVDRIDAQLRTHASLMLLFWYRKALHEMLTQSLYANDGQPQHCLALLHVLDQGLQQVHRFCPEERAIVGDRGVRAAELFLGTIMDALVTLCYSVVTKTRQLRAQTQPIEVVHRFQRSLKNRGGGSEPAPGTESLYLNHIVRSKFTSSLRLARKQVAEICGAVREQGAQLVVFNVEFDPREYLADAVQDMVRRTLRKDALQSAGPQRPSVLLGQLKDLIQAMHTVEHHISVNLSDIIRETIYREFSDAMVGGVGELLPEAYDVKQATKGDGDSVKKSPAAGSSGGRRLSRSERNKEAAEEKKKSSLGSNAVLIHPIAQWYTKTLQKDLGAVGITFSPFRHGLVTRATGSSSNSGVSTWPADQFADINELRALCQIIGPRGVRVLDAMLVTEVAHNVGTIKELVRANAKVLRSMSNRFAENLFWEENHSKIKQLDTLMAHSIAAGMILKFRTLLNRALREVTSEGVPFIFESVSLLYRQCPPNFKADPRLQPLHSIASDCGLPTRGPDAALVNALRKFKMSKDDETLWRLLPELYGVMFVSPSWCRAHYLIDTESHANNAHCVADTVHHLILTFESIMVPGSEQTNPRDIQTNIYKELERFARNAAHSLLHIVLDRKGVFGSYPHQSMMVFIEQFINATGGRLKMAVIEDFFPFTLLRTTYIQLYEKQVVNGVSYAPVQEEEKE